MTPLPSGATEVIEEDIIGSLGKTPVELSPLTGVQQAGVWIAAGIGAAGVFVLVVILWQWSNHVPPVPTIAINSAVNSQAITDTLKTFEYYKLATEIAAQQPLSLADSLLAKIIVPLFTLVLGYIFGAQQTKESKD